jgi:DNA invertase Pin-like site-specific DNA recombinase
MAVYGYVRVSTDRQADEGESLGVQERTIAGYAMMHGMTIDHVYVERVSGAKPIGQRPEGAKLLGILQPGDVVIAAKLDRLFRSALDALEVHAQFIKRGIGLHLIDLGGDIANGLSKLFYTIAVAFAEAERDRIRERVLGTKADQRKRGRFLGGTAPFGWQVGEDGGLIEVPEQQAVIQKLVKLRREGLSLRAIAAKIGGTVSHVTVKNILSQAGVPAYRSISRLVEGAYCPSIMLR